jgi:hypothetical protein
MYIVELAFGGQKERLTARPAHRARLERLREDGVLHMAGPFTDDSGALLIFDVHDEVALNTILADDPYYRTLGAPAAMVANRRRMTPSGRCSPRRHSAVVGREAPPPAGVTRPGSVGSVSAHVAQPR